ncbi:Lrp/AsnC family transcriptional regulator [Candidatus Woesearchaeota archaeon]|nr:Lrp/AsnC family transcriptional regulator [Candidatus Woesearchaeota archaeon]
MKNITPRLIELFKHGFCTPQITQLAKKMKEPSTTIHYNIKKMEKEGAIKAYKAVFDYKKIGLGYCAYLLIRVSQDKYGKIDDVCEKLAKHNEVESVDIVTGDFEVLVKLRVKDSDEYYQFIQYIINNYSIIKAVSMTSLKQFKSEFVG